jgi:hypothetical protein
MLDAIQHQFTLSCSLGDKWSCNRAEQRGATSLAVANPVTRRIRSRRIRSVKREPREPLAAAKAASVRLDRIESSGPDTEPESGSGYLPGRSDAAAPCVQRRSQCFRRLGRAYLASVAVITEEEPMGRRRPDLVEVQIRGSAAAPPRGFSVCLWLCAATAGWLHLITVHIETAHIASSGSFGQSRMDFRATIAP